MLYTVNCSTIRVLGTLAIAALQDKADTAGCTPLLRAAMEERTLSEFGVGGVTVLGKGFQRITTLLLLCFEGLASNFGSRV